MHARDLEAAVVTAARVLTEEELAALLADAQEVSQLGMHRGPLPAVLDTDFVRTGLHYQLSKGVPPRSVRSARDRSVRLFMEYDTLIETGLKLAKFAAQLGVPEAELRRILNEDWLPHVDVVKLPASLREADPRAQKVRDLDSGDFPAAALAALLSPCLLLTHNYKHFGALGVRTRTQGRDGVMAVVAINVGEMQVRAIVLIPASPVIAVGAAAKSAADRMGPVAWWILALFIGLAIGGGIWWYRKQPQERRDQIKDVAVEIGSCLMEEFTTAANGVERARLRLRACVVPRPDRRSAASAVLREFALSADALSAQQLVEVLDPAVRPPVADLRAWLREHDGTVFKQVRRGGFMLGSNYELSS